MKRWTDHCLRALAGLPLIFLQAQAMAGEGGGSVYLQGTYGDFAAGAGGPAGFYLRNDLTYYDAEVGLRPLGGRLSAGADQGVWLNLLKLSVVTDLKVLGGTFVAGAAFPYALDVDVNGRLGVGDGFGVFAQGTTHGFGDPYITPAAINWTRGVHNTTVGIAFNVPWGKYDVDNILNLGRNYWAFDPTVSYSYLDDKGWDLSFTAGILFNQENPDTDYTTGDEFHLDFNLARHLSPTFGIGLTGYWYEQISDDEGELPVFLRSRDGFRGSGFGIGPSVTTAFQLGGHGFNLIAKWLHDVEDDNRWAGDLVMVSLATRI